MDNSKQTLCAGFAAGALASTIASYLMTAKTKSPESPNWADGRTKGLEILPQILDSLMKQWDGSKHLNGKTGRETPVINYLDPNDLGKALSKDWLLNPTNVNKTTLLHLEDSGLDMFGTKGSDALVEMMNTMMKYSVDTSHPHFYNQMYGTLDPAAMCGELVSLFQNVSNYTYEACPCYSMMEAEVLTNFCKLLGWDFSKSDGMMMPGGSTSNLMALHIARHHLYPDTQKKGMKGTKERLCAFVSKEAHYSFIKTIGVLGMGRNNLIKVETTQMGGLDIDDLNTKIAECKAGGGSPFFIGCTAGSTVKGTYDNFEACADIAKKNKLWMHIDGAWGGSALFSDRPEFKKLMSGSSRADSFTVNPHKMLGTPLQTTIFMTSHNGLLLDTNSSEAKYLFDKRKKNAHLDIGDGTFLCGRKNDSIKIWCLWKFRGKKGIAARVESNADNISTLADKIRKHPNFMLACEPWPFNVNFLYLPKRIRKMMEDEGIDTSSAANVKDFPEHIAEAISTIAIKLKLRLQEKGLAMLPYQPLVGQKAQVFRVILAGCRDDYGEAEMDELMTNCVEYGDDL